MDPLSITGIVVALTFQCVKLGKQVKDAFGKYAEAPEALKILEDECQVVGTVLSHLTSDLGSHAVIPFESPLYTVFQHAVKCSEALLICIDTEFKALMGRKDWKTKVATLWKDHEMQDLVQKLGRKKTDINLLISCLSMPSAPELQAHLQRNEGHMDAARQDLVDLAPSYPRAHSSIREVLESGSIESILSGDTESVTTKTRFDFDSLLLNTRTYRAAYQRRPLRHYHRVTGVAIKTPYREEEVDLIDLATVTKVPVPAMPVSRFAVDLEELGLRGNDTATRDIGCELYPGLHTHNKPIVHGIQSKDVVALMNHLTVRDAQRNARDTEILVDLTRSAADMRSAFGDVRKFLAETDDLLLSNTEGSGGSGELASRPLAQSAVSDGTRHLQYKKKSLFRRAMKGLSLKGGNDQAVIEEMLVNLLTQTEELRQQTGQDGTTTAGMLSGYRDQKLSREGITTPVSDRGLQCSPEHATGGECALSQFPDDLQKAFRVPRKSLTPSITP